MSAPQHWVPMGNPWYCSGPIDASVVMQLEF